MTNIFDSHAHYDDGWFDSDRDELLASLPDKGVCGIVNNSVDLNNAKTVLALAEKYPFIYAAVGIHPENLEGLPEDYLDRIAELTKHPKVVAIGETGLDYHWDIPKDAQNHVFEEQLQLSLELGMPIIVHDREAHGDTFDKLRKYRPNALVHCFSGSVELMREAFTGNKGSKRKVLIGGSRLMGYLSNLDYDRVVMSRESVSKWGIDFTEIRSKFGTLYLLLSEVFDECGMSECGLVLDPDYIQKYVHVPFSTEALNLKSSGLRNTDALVLTEASCLVLRYPKAHMRIVRR